MTALDTSISQASNTGKPDTRERESIPRMSRPRLVRSRGESAAIPAATILAETADYLNHYVGFPSAGVADAVALFVARDHVFAATESQLYPTAFSVVGNSGKSTFFQVVSYLLPGRPRNWGATTAAPIYTRIDAEHPSVMLDKVGSVVNRDCVVSEILDCANRRHGATIPRMRIMGDGQAIDYEYNVYAPIWLSGVNLDTVFPYELLTRCMMIELTRERAKYRMTRAEADRARHAGNKIRDRLAAWIAPHIPYLSEAEPVIPPELARDSRVTEGLTVPQAIADLAGREWGERGRENFTALIAPRLDDVRDPNLMLLRDAAAVMAGSGRDKMPTIDILAGIAQLDSAPHWLINSDSLWMINPNARAYDRGSQMRFANAMRRFKVESRKIRFGTKTANGYATADVTQAWERYR